MESFRGLLIKLLSVVMVLVVVLATLAGFVIGGNSNPWQGFNLFLALLGGVGGFIGGALSAGMLALLLDIRELLKKIALSGQG